MPLTQSDQATTDVVVVGGGVIGCAIAYYLRRHQIAVTVLERGNIGEQASGAAAGLLAPLGPLSGPGPLADLVLASFARFPALVAELEEATGLHLGYEQTGALRLVRHPKRVAHLHKRWQHWQPLGLQMVWLTQQEVHQHEPHLAPEVCAAVYAPQEAQIDARHLTHAFAQAALTLGARLLPHHNVTELLVEKQRVVGVRTAQGTTIRCDRLILAAGAWAGTWSARLGLPLPIEPLHGQLLSLPQITPPLRVILFGEGIYIIPRGPRLVVGATREARGFDLHADPAGTVWLLETAARLVPSLATHQVERIWTGLRPKTPDTRPIFGPAPPWENVSLAVGYNSLGILLSAITGQCMAEWMLSGQVDPLFQPFTLQRFLSAPDLGK
ncbi:MAG TPA: glycine oxidase ThiO [Ktedonobacteraceae bacterium]|nr:glycine oxidase ThiO [Ktedonobacteraceae bacterium]